MGFSEIHFFQVAACIQHPFCFVIDVAVVIEFSSYGWILLYSYQLDTIDKLLYRNLCRANLLVCFVAIELYVIVISASYVGVL